MLLTSDANDLYDAVTARWARLMTWTQQSTQAAPVKVAIEHLHAHWKEVDNGVLTDSQELCGAYLELEAAETNAKDHGFTPPPGYHATNNESCGIRATLGGQTSQAVEEEVQKHSDLNRLTAPQDKSWCQRAGVPDIACDKDGIESWVYWALGGLGAALVGGGLYVSYRAATSETGQALTRLALEGLAPEAVPVYDVVRGTRHVPSHVEEAVDQEARTRASYKTLKSAR